MTITPVNPRKRGAPLFLSQSHVLVCAEGDGVSSLGLRSGGTYMGLLFADNPKERDTYVGMVTSVALLGATVVFAYKAGVGGSLADLVANATSGAVGVSVGARWTALEAELKRMIRACEGGKIGTCSVLAALGQHENCLHEQHDGAEVLAGLPSKGA